MLPVNALTDRLISPSSGSESVPSSASRNSVFTCKSVAAWRVSPNPFVVSMSPLMVLMYRCQEEYVWKVLT